MSSPASRYPSTTGWWMRWNRTVVTAATHRISASALRISRGVCAVGEPSVDSTFTPNMTAAD